MAIENPNCNYMLVIDTDQYSGNFERELTGFCTGVDDGTHGALEGEDFKSWLNTNNKSTTWGDIITFIPEENGYPRVCSIWPTPGRLNNGMGFHYNADNPEEDNEAHVELVESLKKYYASQNEMCERRIATGDFQDEGIPGGWTKEACERTLIRNRECIEQAYTQKRAWPAFESVAIFLKSEPSNMDIEIFMERLKDFSDDVMRYGERTGTKLNIKNVRLIKWHQQQETLVKSYIY